MRCGIRAGGRLMRTDDALAEIPGDAFHETPSDREELDDFQTRLKGWMEHWCSIQPLEQSAQIALMIQLHKKVLDKIVYTVYTEYVQ